MIKRNILKLFVLIAVIVFSVTCQELEFKEPEAEAHPEFLQQEERDLQGGCFPKWYPCTRQNKNCCAPSTCNFAAGFCQ